MRSSPRVVQVPTPLQSQGASEPKPPSEEDVVQASVKQQKQQKRRKQQPGQGGYMSTVLQNQPGNKLG